MGEEDRNRPETTGGDVVLNRDGTVRQRAGRKPRADPEELTQLEQNVLIDNLPNVEMLVEALGQACVLLRQKDQLERQVDTLQRQVYDARQTLEREQQRFGEAKAQRMEFARG